MLGVPIVTAPLLGCELQTQRWIHQPGRHREQQPPPVGPKPVVFPAPPKPLHPLQGGMSSLASLGASKGAGKLLSAP